MKQELLDFIRSQKLMAIASGEGGVWIANVYYGIDDDGKLYFISPIETRHSEQIMANPNVAFSITWYNTQNHKDRKAVQGLGACRIAESENEIKKGVELHNQNFPEFASIITIDWIHTNEFGSRIWVIEPSYVKFWDDELYGSEESEEFTLS